MVASDDDNDDGDRQGTFATRQQRDRRTETERETLSCRVLGFYPFPTPPPKGPLGWALRETHQAVLVRSSLHDGDGGGGVGLLMDFMTEGEEFHPVWSNEAVKWHVLLGGNIRGEVRVRFVVSSANKEPRNQMTEETEASLSPRMRDLLTFARWHDRDMNLYVNNCRVFAARIEREVERLNNEKHHDSLESGGDGSAGKSIDHGAKEQTVSCGVKGADVRLFARLFGAGLLPALYPLTAILLSYEGLRDLW